MDELDDFQCFTDSLDSATGYTHEPPEYFPPLNMNTLSHPSHLGEPMFGFECAPDINSQQIPANNTMAFNSEYGHPLPQPNLPNNALIPDHESLNFIDDESLLDCIIKSTQLLKNAIAGSYEFDNNSVMYSQPVEPPNDILRMNHIDECFDTILPSATILDQINPEFNTSQPISNMNFSDLPSKNIDTKELEEKNEEIHSSTTKYAKPTEGTVHEATEKNTTRAKSTGRMRRKDELAYLRFRAADLEAELLKLKERNQQSNHSFSSHSNVLQVFSMWKRIAVRQKSAREKAQTENMRLRELLKRQLRIAHGLEGLLRKRPHQTLTDPSLIEISNPNNKLLCNIDIDALLWSQSGTYDLVLKQIRDCTQLLGQKQLYNCFEDISENSVSHRSDGRILVETRESFLLPFALERIHGVEWDTRDTIGKAGQGFQKTIKSSDNSLVQEIHRFLQLHHINIPVVTILTLVRTSRNGCGFLCWQNNGQVDCSRLFTPQTENVPTSASQFLKSEMCLNYNLMDEADYEHVCVIQKGWSMLQKTIIEDGTVDEDSCHLIWYTETELCPKGFGRRAPQNSLTKYATENSGSIKDECMDLLTNMYRNLSAQDSPVLNRVLESLVREDSKQSEYKGEGQ
uniref:AlNc14C104G6153 protein n=1 Tax=Albugo laibachii Nc14 TaxID=890382 RepID=F0WHU6_9STRA|nr:AlNc14C104G6153 [Albugo laibachii Nc14]|eukprot:CCA20821.1 AlNc14C104G6153 [Albugo laibachii Nc14]